MSVRLIQCVIDWERRLEIEEERCNLQRRVEYVNYLALPQPCRPGQRFIRARIFLSRPAGEAARQKEADRARSGYNGWLEQINLGAR